MYVKNYFISVQDLKYKYMTLGYHVVIRWFLWLSNSTSDCMSKYSLGKHFNLIIKPMNIQKGCKHPYNSELQSK